MASSEATLVARLRSGETHAFQVLFERHRDAVRQRLEGMLRDANAADDLVQEVFVRLWTRAEQWRGQGSLRAWLVRIATNLALNRIRSDRLRRTRPFESSMYAPRDEQDDAVPAWMIDEASLGPDEVIGRAEECDRLRGLVTELSEEKRQVIDMIFGEEMDIASAARELGIPEGTVKSRLHYAKRELADRGRQIGLGEEET